MKKTPPPSEASSEKFVGSRPEKSLLLGWAGLALYIGLGIGLEALHALKVGFYLDPSNSARRLMWTLSHVHGPCFRCYSSHWRLLPIALSGQKTGLVLKWRPWL